MTEMEGVNLIKIYCKHICKCHSASPLYNYYMLIKNQLQNKTAGRARRAELRPE
jgi:hypothetical protein